MILMAMLWCTMETEIKVGDLVTCNSSNGLSFHNCKVVDILDDGLIKAELPEPIKYIIVSDDLVELQNARNKEEKDDTNN